MSTLLLGPQCCCDCCPGFTYDQDECTFLFHGNSSCKEIPVISWEWEELNLLDPEDDWEVFSNDKDPDEISFPFEDPTLVAERLIRLTETLQNGTTCTYTSRVECVCTWNSSILDDIRAFGLYTGSLSAVEFDVLLGDLVKLDGYSPIGCTGPVDCDLLAGRYTLTFANSFANGPDYFEHYYTFNSGSFGTPINLCGAPSTFIVSHSGQVRIVANTGVGGGSIGVSIRVSVNMTLSSPSVSLNGVWENAALASCLGGPSISFAIPPTSITPGFNEFIYVTCGTQAGGRSMNVRFVP